MYNTKLNIRICLHQSCLFIILPHGSKYWAISVKLCLHGTLNSRHFLFIKAIGVVLQLQYIIGIPEKSWKQPHGHRCFLSDLPKNVRKLKNWFLRNSIYFLCMNWRNLSRNPKIPDNLCDFCVAKKQKKTEKKKKQQQKTKTKNN